MTRSQLEEWVEAVEQLPTLVDGQWLEAEVSKVVADVAADTSGGRRMRIERRPLAELTYQVRQELPNVRATGRGTVSLAKLGMIAMSIRILRGASVVGLDDRVARLTSDKDAFEAARFELEVAALHVVMSHGVRFLPEDSGAKTADLEVDQAIEIECKHKVALSKRDRAMREVWALLKRRLHDVLPNAGAYRVELWTRAAPTRGDVSWALNRARSALADLNESDHTTVPDVEAGRELGLYKLRVESVGGSIRGVDPPGTLPMDAFDYGTMEVTAQLANRMLRPHRAVQLLFRTDDRPDWISRVSASLRKARSQLSGDRPGIVYVEVPAVMESSKGPGIAALKAAVDAAFRDSKRLSAIAIAITGWREDGDGNGHAVAEYHVERNPDARHPLPRATTSQEKRSTNGGRTQDETTRVPAAVAESSSSAAFPPAQHRVSHLRSASIVP